jgi:hypothetical protein
MAGNRAKPQIRLGNTSLHVRLLSKDAYYGMIPDFYKEPKFTKAYPFDSYVKEKRDTEDRLEKALGAIWTPNDDFQVGYDTNRAFTLCGGVYSPRVICQDYLNILFTILHATRMKDKWMYSTQGYTVDSTDPYGLWWSPLALAWSFSNCCGTGSI